MAATPAEITSVERKHFVKIHCPEHESQLCEKNADGWGLRFSVRWPGWGSPLCWREHGFQYRVPTPDENPNGEYAGVLVSTEATEEQETLLFLVLGFLEFERMDGPAESFPEGSRVYVYRKSESHHFKSVVDVNIWDSERRTPISGRRQNGHGSS